MDIHLEKELPLSAQELHQILLAPEFAVFLNNEYGVYVDMEIQETTSGNSTEINRPDHHETRWRIDLSALKKKFRASGMLQLFHIEGNRCLLILKGRIHIGRFGVGRFLERKVAKRVQRGSDRFYGIITKWRSENTKCDKPAKETAGG